MNITLKSVACAVLLASAVNTYAQQGVADSTFKQAPVNNTIAYFSKAMNTQSGLYNGQEYLFYNRQKDDNVFLENQTTWSNGTVSYDGTFYGDVPLMYDLLRGQVIVLLYDKTSNVILNNYKISGFTLLNHQFVYRNADSLNTNGFKPGIYDQIYSGRTEVLVRRSKSLYITQSQKNTYNQKNEIYVKHDDVYFEVGSKGKLLNVLKDKKKELRKYINDNNIEFKDNKESAIARVVLFYDKLTQ
jgi:hypothetical protein